jgi:hypothetical protein
MLDPDVLAMAPVDQQQRPLQQFDDVVAELAAELDQLLLLQAGAAEAPLDVGLVVIGLGLGDPPQAVGIDRQQPQRRLVVDADAPEGRDHVQHRAVVLAGPVGGLRRGEAEGPVQRQHQRQRHPAVGGELFVGSIQPLGCGHRGRLEEARVQQAE